MKKCEINKSPSWRKLSEQAQYSAEELKLSTLFSQDLERFNKFSFHAPGLIVDLSKQHISQEVFNNLIDLAHTSNLTDKRNALFSGEYVNATEHRQALHTALRSPQSPYKEQIQRAKNAMFEFAEHIRSDHNITDIVNVGTGGSDLGPRLAIQALTPFKHPDKKFHFIANIDPFDVSQTLQNLNPKNTLFIITSKSFTTQETIANTNTIKQWFEASSDQSFSDHCVAVTANTPLAHHFGIEKTLAFWDWVGGRYSIWSSVGLSLAICIGQENFQAFLNGAYEMDQHFLTTSFDKNVPVLLALTDIWNRNFLNRLSRCIAPYHQGLAYLPAYLQQLEMESNGKSVNIHGEPIDYNTSGIVWGETGNNAQHAFFQMLHQGTDIVPVDFILIKELTHPSFKGDSDLIQLLQQQHRSLLMNGLAQSRALMIGKTYQEAINILKEQEDLSLDMLDSLAHHQTFAGNRPSSTIILERLSPYTLGSLIALHEHRTFVTGAIWNVNSFDQWGVELGKTIAKKLESEFLNESSQHPNHLDTSTTGLMRFLKNK